MSTVPQQLRYTPTHEWVATEGDSIVTIGITEHAQELLGDMVFIELPEVGSHVARGEECAVVESVKAASDIYAPLGGMVVEVNEALEESPETVNQDPYGEGWIFRLKIDDKAELEGLLGVDAYSDLAAEES